jgi:hypothetical protein
MKPYTYRIGWTKLNVYYYGVRYAKDCHPDDLWVSYFTSSKYVDEFRQLHGEPDVVQVRKVFRSVDAAREWEHKVLRRMKVIHRDDFLNKTDGKSIDPEAGRQNAIRTSARRLADGTHTFLIPNFQRDVQYKRIADGTHNLLGKGEVTRARNLQQVADGTHPFLGKGEAVRQRNLQQLADGTHNFLKSLAAGTHPIRLKWKCEHCGKDGANKTNYVRFHGPKCKSIIDRPMNQG